MTTRKVGKLPNISLKSVELDGFNNAVMLNLERVGDLSKASAANIYVAFPVEFGVGESEKNLMLDGTGDFEIANTGKFHVLIADPVNAAITYNLNQVTIATPITPTSVVSLTSVSANEGDALTHIATLSNSNGGSIPFSIIPITVGLGDYLGSPTFGTSGVLLNAGNLIVPEGIIEFPIVISSVEDGEIESNEAYTINLGGKTATGVIINDDFAPVPSFVTAISNQIVAEGELMTFIATLNISTPAAQDFTFGISGTATANTDYATPVVVRDAGGNTLPLSGNTFTLPTGNASFSVHVSTNTDSTAEGTETVTFTVGGITATGSMTNVDTVPATILTIVQQGSTYEGENLVFLITTNKPTIAGQRFTPTLTGAA